MGSQRVFGGDNTTAVVKNFRGCAMLMISAFSHHVELHEVTQFFFRFLLTHKKKMNRLLFLCATCFLLCYAGRSEAIFCPRHNITTYTVSPWKSPQVNSPVCQYIVPDTLDILYTYQGHILHLSNDNTIFCSGDGGKTWGRPSVPHGNFGLVRRIVTSTGILQIERKK